MVVEREVDMHKHWSRSSIVICVCLATAVSSQPNVCLHLKLICHAILDRSQCLFYFVPKESHSQTGSARGYQTLHWLWILRGPCHQNHTILALLHCLCWWWWQWLKDWNILLFNLLICKRFPFLSISFAYNRLLLFNHCHCSFLVMLILA